MRKLTTFMRWPDLVVLGAGGVSAALGLVVLVGWQTQSQALVQVLPALVPMKYNTALGFLLSGLGLVAIALGRPWGALPGAAWSLLLGALTLIQDILALNLGVDELLMGDYLRVETVHPGRLAPNTALCFVLIGLALLLMRSARRSGRPVVLGIGGSITAALGVTAVFGYLSGLTPAYGWGHLTPMAVQTAGGCALLGLGILAFAWGDARALPRWLAIPVAIGVVTITLIVWQALRAQEHAHIKRSIAAETASVKNEIIDQVDTRVEALERMARRWEALGTPAKERWASDAWVLVIDYPGVQVVAWVDPSLRVRWIVPRAGNEAAQGLNLALEERARAAMLQARQLRMVTFTRSIEVAQGGTEFRVFVPIFQGETFGGFILGVFSAQTLLEKFLGDAIAPGYSIAVDDGERDIYRRSKDDGQHRIGWGQETSISLHGVRWRVRVWPTPRLLANAQSSVPEAVLVIGLALASLLGLTICLAQTARRRRNEVEATNRELQARIAERARAEEALRESEDRYRDLVEHSHELICTHDLAGQILSVNEEVIRCLGYDRGTLLKKNIRDILAPEVRDEFETYLQTIRRDGVASGLMQVQTATEDQRIWEYDNSQRTEGVATPIIRAMARDITDRNRAKRALRKSEERYRDLVENAHEIIYTCDLAGNFTSLNRAGETITGYSRDRYTTMNLAQVVAPEYLDLVRQMMVRKLEEDGQTSYELEIIAKDGHRVPLEVNNRLIYEHGRPVGVQAIARDITERKRAEDTQARLVGILEATTDFVAMADAHGRALYLNTGGRRMLGIAEAEDVSGTPIADLHPEWVRALLLDEAIPTAIRDGVWRGETALRTRDGREIPVSQVVLAHKAPDGSVRLLSTIARDLSERKRAEEQLRQAQRLEAIGLLAGGVAHDFNNLLNGIIGFADLALRELPTDSTAHAHLSRVPPMGRQAADLIARLLTFARQAPLERKPLVLNVLLKETTKFLRRTLPETLTIRVEPSREAVAVEADLAQAQQILLNLATNARDAMPDGGTLTLRLAPVTLTAASGNGHLERRPGDFVCLTVADTGTGIPAAIRDRIFDPFFTTKAPGHGTGLGLASVYGIVHQHQGWIEVETTEGQGSAFHVFLPRLPGPAPVAPAASEALPRGTETLLLAEDNPMVLELGEILLSELGYTILTARDGIEALPVFRAHPEIALVLTDAIMPRMGATALIPALRALDPEVKILVATGYASEAIRASLDHLRLEGYIQKPFRQADLALAVRSTLDGPALGPGTAGPDNSPSN